MAEINPKQLKETETAERKQSLNGRALKTLSAFANTKGGSLYIGIKDDARLISKSISDQAQQDIVNKVINHLNIIPEITLHTYKGNEFLEINIRKSTRPISYNGKYYRRSGNTTRELDEEGLRSFFLKNIAWDSQVDDRFSINEIDESSWTQIAAKAGGQRGIPEPGDLKRDEFFQHLNLVVNGKLTHAAILLFGKNPQKYFPYTTIRIGRFKDQSTIIADHKIEGNLVNQLQRAEETIKSLINKGYEITGESFVRRDVWDYPLEALREALLNAIVHRNYHSMGSEIQVKVYDNRIWIWNPGTLPEGLSVEQLKKSHSSIRRNPLIADLFFRAGYIEQFGSGTLRIMDVLKAAGHPEPEFEEHGNGFTIQLFKRKGSRLSKQELQDLNDRQIAALEYLKDHESINNSTYQKLFNVAKSTATRDLKELTEKGQLQRIGKKGYGTHYKLE
jgi:ATP-dependent DNA helicase RecG